jgi:hypothetical protein
LLPLRENTFSFRSYSNLVQFLRTPHMMIAQSKEMRHIHLVEGFRGYPRKPQAACTGRRLPGLKRMDITHEMKVRLDDFIEDEGRREYLMGNLTKPFSCISFDKVADAYSSLVGPWTQMTLPLCECRSSCQRSGAELQRRY